MRWRDAVAMREEVSGTGAEARQGVVWGAGWLDTPSVQQPASDFSFFSLARHVKPFAVLLTRLHVSLIKPSVTQHPASSVFSRAIILSFCAFL